MEFLSGIFVGYLLNWYALGILIFLGIMLEHNEWHTLSIFIGLGSAFIAYSMFNLSPLAILFWSVGYFVVGLLWSFWRYKRWVQKCIKSRSLSTGLCNTKDLLPSKNTDKLVTWILIWPFSMIENVTGDIINLITLTVTTVFKSTYQRIYDSAMKDVQS